LKVTIVSPTYNEAENVERLVRAVDAALAGIDYELLIADDDSPDRTWEIAEGLALRNPHLRVLRRTKNRGLSQAVIDGFLSSSSDYVGVIDADLQHDPAILPRMVAALDSGAEIAVGSRYTDGGGTGTWGTSRRFQSWFATKLAQTFLGVDLTDPMSGYFVLLRRDFNRIQKELDATGFKILLEIIARLNPSRLQEVPYTFRERVAGRSKLSPRVIFQYFEQLWKLSSVSRYMSVRFIKFALVGTSGIIVNLCAFLAFAKLFGMSDWRISMLAAFFANFTNYLFNNAWTFVDRTHGRWSLLRGYISYLVLSSIGLFASTLTFASLARIYQTLLHQPYRNSYMVGLAFQLAAIFVGTFFNYELNSRFTWRQKAGTRQQFSELANLSENDCNKTRG